MAKRARFGDWTKGQPKDTETWNISYSWSDSENPEWKGSGKVQVASRSQRGAKVRIVKQIQRRFPHARVTIRRCWRPGQTPGGIWLPRGVDWIDDEVEGKGRTPR